MPPVKGHSEPFAKRLERLLRLLSPWLNKPLTYGELAEKLGPTFSEEAVKSWAKRGEFAAAARERLVELATEEGLVGVTAIWLREGVGPQPQKGGAAPPSGPQAGLSLREPYSGYPSGAGDEDAAYLRAALEVSRALSNADLEGLPLEAKLRLIDLAEKVMVPVHGKRAKTFLDDERDRLRGGDSSGGRSGP